MKSQSQLAGEQTREAILDAAEELFAVHGPESVSIRSVNAAARVASASTHYHFGSKDALVLAVLRRRGWGVTRRYYQLLTDLEGKDSPTPRDLIEVFAKPLLELLDRVPTGGLRWLKFSAHLAQARDARLQLATTGPGSVNERFATAVVRALQDVPVDVALLRWQIAASAVLRLLASADMPLAHLPGDPTTGISPAYVEALLDFSAAGLAGDSAETTHRSNLASSRLEGGDGRRPRPRKTD